MAVGAIAPGGGAIDGIAVGGAAAGIIAVGGAAVACRPCGAAAFGRYVISAMERSPEAVQFFEAWLPWANGCRTTPRGAGEAYGHRRPGG